jgi:mannose-6-phosphate isomerase-like protein (cupin superfamily)
MDHVLHADDSPDGRLLEVEGFTQRLCGLAGSHCHDFADELLYVLDGTGKVTIGDETHHVGPGTCVFVARGARWSGEGDARAVAVLVHDPEPASTDVAVLDLTRAEHGAATAGRAFVLGATPDAGCNSATQFVGLIPPGRAPDHFHRYDEVIYVLDGEGVLEIGGERAPLRAGSCIHLPRTHVHCIANTGNDELRVLGVFRPAGSPAEAYYPDGTPAIVEQS